MLSKVLYATAAEGITLMKNINGALLLATDLKGGLTSGQTAMDPSAAETKNYEDGQHQLELGDLEAAPR